MCSVTFSRAHVLFFKMASMIQAIRDLADAFVPSGKLIELVDKDLVSRQSNISLCMMLNHNLLKYTTLLNLISG